MPESSPKPRPFAFPLIIALVCVAVYGRVTGYFFFWGDDQLHLSGNPYLSPPTWSGVAHLWRHAYAGLYIPVSYTAFAALSLAARMKRPDAAVNDTDALLNPHIFHAANLALHVANALLVYAILRRCVKNDVASLVGALLFAVHPLQVEAVAWVSELRGLLASFFSLGALVLYVRRGDSGNARISTALYLSSSALFALALLSKPSAIVVPLVALALDGWLNRRGWKRYAAELLPWAAASTVLLALTRTAQTITPDVRTDLWLRPFVAGDALAFYLAKLFVPVRLSIDYCRTPSVVAANWWGYVTWLVPVAVGVVCWRLRIRAPWLGVAALVSAASLLPVLGLVPFTFQQYSTVADRYCYLAMLGPALVASSLWPALPRCWRTAGCVALVALACISFARVGRWHDTGTLTASALEYNPSSSYSHVNRAAYLQYKGDDVDALRQAELAVHYHPDIPYAYFNVGNSLLAVGQVPQAINAFKRALQTDPPSAKEYMNLGAAYIEAGDNEDALAELNKALSIEAKYPTLHYNIGNALSAENRFMEANGQYDIEREINPTYAANDVNEAISYVNLRQPQQAIALLTSAISMGSPKASWYVDRGVAEQMAGENDTARTDFNRALAIDPNNADAKSALAGLGK